MSNAASLAVENIPYFLETGQNLISQLAADPRLLSNDSNQLMKTWLEDIRLVPFFTQITLLDKNSQVLASYPTADFVGPQAPIEEITGIQIAVNHGVPVQTFTIQPSPGQTTAQVSFVAIVTDATQNVKAVLVGRSDLSFNPFTRPIIHSLESSDSGWRYWNAIG